MADTAGIARPSGLRPRRSRGEIGPSHSRPVTVTSSRSSRMRRQGTASSSRRRSAGRSSATPTTAHAQSMFERLADEDFAYLTTVGRKSGRRHRIEIWFALHDGRVYLLSGGGDAADWVKNIRAHGDVRIQIG